MNTIPNNPRVIVSAILEKVVDGRKMIYTQTRWKPNTSPAYTGLIEIPAGGIDHGFENIFDALKREVKEETGLEVVKIVQNMFEVTENRKGDIQQIFTPFVCQQTLSSIGGLPWIGFVFICEVTGTVNIQKTEAKDPRWITLKELSTLIEKKPETIFPLQYGVLKYYLTSQSVELKIP